MGHPPTRNPAEAFGQRAYQPPGMPPQASPAGLAAAEDGAYAARGPAGRTYAPPAPGGPSMTSPRNGPPMGPGQWDSAMGPRRPDPRGWDAGPDRGVPFGRPGPDPTVNPRPAPSPRDLGPPGLWDYAGPPGRSPRDFAGGPLRPPPPAIPQATPRDLSARHWAPLPDPSAYLPGTGPRGASPVRLGSREPPQQSPIPGASPRDLSARQWGPPPDPRAYAPPMGPRAASPVRLPADWAEPPTSGRNSARRSRSTDGRPDGPGSPPLMSRSPQRMSPPMPPRDGYGPREGDAGPPRAPPRPSPRTASPEVYSARSGGPAPYDRPRSARYPPPDHPHRPADPPGHDSRADPEGQGLPVDDRQCHACAEEIGRTEYFEADGRVFHSGCFTCRKCRTRLGPTVEFYRHGDVYYCAGCFGAYRDVCVYCVRPMQGKRVANFWREALCSSHLRDSLLTDCQDCGRIVPAQSPSRTVSGLPYTQCDVCLQAAVHSEEQARRLVADVGRALEAEYRFTLGQPLGNVPLQFQPIPDLMQLSADHGHHGKTPRLVGGLTEACARDGRPALDRLVLPLAVSADRLATLAAHELMHAFLLLHRFPLAKLGATFEEGACELLAYLWMTSAKQKDKPTYQFWTDQMARGRDPVFGDGFRRMRTAFERYVELYDRETALPRLLADIRKQEAAP
eukprot:EG_transcript_2285